MVLCICTSSAAEDWTKSTYAEQVQVMTVECLSQQVQVYVLVALDLRQSQHPKGCVTPLCNLSGSRSHVQRGETQGSGTRSMTTDTQVSESVWHICIIDKEQQAEWPPLAPDVLWYDQGTRWTHRQPHCGARC